MPAVARVVVLQARFVGVAPAGRDGADAALVGKWVSLREVRSSAYQPIIAALRHGIAAEESAAIVDDGLFPLELVERLGGEVLGQPL
ncbi:hypothetical protein D3C76_1670670 [compost metagenome]